MEAGNAKKRQNAWEQTMHKWKALVRQVDLDLHLSVILVPDWCRA